jgi:hypothetical protein
MKKIYYEVGPDEICVGPVNAQIAMKRGEPTEVSDEFAASLLKKPLFKEASDNASSPPPLSPSGRGTKGEGSLSIGGK